MTDQRRESPFSALDKALVSPKKQPARQQTGKTVSQHASKPVTPLVKATFYLTPDQIVMLETVRLERLQRGEKVDKSALVREAIDQLVREASSQHDSKPA